MRHVAGFSNSTKIRFIVNGFGMYGTVNDIYTSTLTVTQTCVIIHYRFNKGVDMNNWDKGNLDFILNSTDEDMEDFLSWASDEDLLYALQLIQIAKAELEVKEIEMLETEANEDFSQAQAVLEQFRL